MLNMSLQARSIIREQFCVVLIILSLGTIEFDFVEHHTHFNVYVSQQSKIQIEDENHAIYMSFC